MAGHGLSVEKLADLGALAERWGGIIADEAGGGDGPGFDVDLAGIEDVAFVLARALNKGVCEALTGRQAERLPEVRPCPSCGAECPVESPDEADDGRTMQARGGPFELREPKCHCDGCRRSFFPSADGSEDQRQGLQSEGLYKLMLTAGDVASFKKGANHAREVVEAPISPKHLAALVQEVGTELADARDERAERHRLNQLQPDPDQPPGGSTRGSPATDAACTSRVGRSRSTPRCGG